MLWYVCTAGSIEGMAVTNRSNMRVKGGEARQWHPIWHKRTCSNTTLSAACSCLQVNKASYDRRTSHQSAAGWMRTRRGAQASRGGGEGSLFLWLSSDSLGTVSEWLHYAAASTCGPWLEPQRERHLRSSFPSVPRSAGRDDVRTKMPNMNHSAEPLM